jgi:hypothetical protein
VLKNVVDITYSENAFYVIATDTINNESHPIVYKISLADENPKVENILSENTQAGSALEIVTDVFGTIYYCTKNVNNYDFYSFDGNEVKFIASRPIELDILNLQTDFDGKLYALYENNKIDIISETGVITKELKTSPNLGSISPAKSMCLSCNSQTAYFIFEGLILNSSEVSDLNIATPHTINIPDGFNTSFSQAQEFARVKEGAKLFEIDITNLDGEYFKFLDYQNATSPQTDYAVIKLNDKYSLLINGDVCAVARNSDVINRRLAEEFSSSKFAVAKPTYLSAQP